MEDTIVYVLPVLIYTYSCDVIAIHVSISQLTGNWFVGPIQKGFRTLDRISDEAKFDQSNVIISKYYLSLSHLLTSCTISPL